MRSRTTPLASRLRQLRIEARLNQKAVATALGVSIAMISTWESGQKQPTRHRIDEYAVLFAIADPEQVPLPHPAELTAEQLRKYEQLSRELGALRVKTGGYGQGDGACLPPDLWHFGDGEPVLIICGELPEEDKAPYADYSNHNYIRLCSYADLDALFELFSYIKTRNPRAEVRHKLSREVVQSDLAAHIVLLGGLGLTQFTADITRLLDFPVQQIDVGPDFEGEIFALRHDPSTRFVPKLGTTRDKSYPVEDIALVARSPNPQNTARTLTICSGVYTHGVHGAVRCLTDPVNGPRNTQYLLATFDTAASFGFLARVPIIGHAPATPDLTNPANLLYGWPTSPD